MMKIDQIRNYGWFTFKYSPTWRLNPVRFDVRYARVFPTKTEDVGIARARSQMEAWLLHIPPLLVFFIQPIYTAEIQAVRGVQINGPS